MLIKIIILGAILFIFFGVFTYLSYRKIPEEYNFKLIRRLYYLLIMVYIAAFVIVFKSDFKNIQIFNINNTVSTIANALAAGLALFILSVIWEYIFISCRSFKNIKFKNFEITVDEQKVIEHLDKLRDKEIGSLYNVLFAKIRMLKYINDYVEQKEFLNPQEFYNDILQEYKKVRKNIEVYIYKEDFDGYLEMRKDLKLTSKELSTIKYSIDMFGFCCPKGFRPKEYNFSSIKTKYTNYDLLVVLESQMIINEENYIIFDIINYFEQVVSLKIMESDTLQPSNSMV
ncbi:MAG TPA: hypothetical protein VHO66_02465 [Ruminiclostridium sp.]|nr:hypothetical protein [Ruminiclostridium sp.]